MARTAARAASRASSQPRRTRALAAASRKSYVIGDYTVVGSPIGKGGYAFVHHVVSKRGASYAIKELRHALKDQRDTVRRFQREFEVTAALGHPNIVKMHECFEANGTWNIRMELIDGTSLESLMRGGDRFPAPLVAALGLPLLAALGFAHRSGAVHRDVKPGNVLVSRAGHVKLTDFGIARLEDVQVTREGILLGTPAYMSPEQLAGKRGAEIDARSDLYSLGVVLYELAARKHPLAIRPKSDIYEIIRVKNERDPTPLAVDGGDALAEVLAKALARDPADRFANADDMAAALRPIAAPKRALKDMLGKRVRAASARPSGRKRAPGRGKKPAVPALAASRWRRYAALAASGAAAVGLAAGLWVAWHPEAVASLERHARQVYERTVGSVLERAREEAGERR